MVTTRKFTHSEAGNIIAVEIDNYLLIFVDGCGYYIRNPTTDMEKIKVVEIDNRDTIEQIMEKCKKVIHEQP